MAKALDAQSFQPFNANTTATATLSGMVATDTLVVAGVTFAAVAESPTGDQFVVGADDTETAANLAAAINASTNAATSRKIQASSAGAVVTLDVIAPGVQVELSTAGGHVTLSHVAIASQVADDYALRIARKSFVLYANASLTATAAVNTGDLDMTGVEEVVVVIKNGNTTQTRTPSFHFKDAAGTTMHTIAASAISANTAAIYSFGKGATATGITGGYALPPSPKFSVTTTAPASGSGGGYVYLWVK